MVNQNEVLKAAGVIVGRVNRTPCIVSEAINRRLGKNIVLKLENRQKTGAFKVRGVTNKINSLTDEQKGRGLICASSGNHGLGVATVSHELGLAATVVIPVITPDYKINKLKEQAARVVIFGESYNESLARARELAEEEGLTFLHGCDDPLIIAGQGTVALEIIEDYPDTDCIVGPIGGGGLVSGLLAAVHDTNPAVAVIGVQAAGAASMYESCRVGYPVGLPQIDTVAEGIAVKKPGELNVEIICPRVASIALVTDPQIIAAMRLLYEETGEQAEAAGAASLAAVMQGAAAGHSGRIACVVSGGNIAPDQFTRLIS